MVDITIYVEGGGDSNRLRTECRQGFKEFFDKLDITSTAKTKINIVVCGGRTTAFKDFRKGIKKNYFCLLLVDSEAPIKDNTSVWQYVLLREGDNWQKPDEATDDHLHFMVECMEAWFMADKNALADYYGKDFNKNSLKNTNIEAISKSDLINTLKMATRNTKKGQYSKGGDSFKILAKIDANEVTDKNNFYAHRLRDKLKGFFTLVDLKNRI